MDFGKSLGEERPSIREIYAGSESPPSSPVHERIGEVRIELSAGSRLGKTRLNLVGVKQDGLM